MKKVVIRILVILVALIAVFGGVFALGYRLNPESAARANNSIGNDAHLVIKLNSSSVGELFVFKKLNYYITTAPEKQGLFWISNINFTTQDIDDKNDLVRSIGWLSITTQTQRGTVMIVQSHDKRVAYIEAGTAPNKEIEHANKDGLFIFDWNQVYIPVQDSRPTAFSNSGKKLYIYSYSMKTPNYIDQKELRWYAVT